MGENSKIQWCDHTFNPWTGCTKVSLACDNCYAESWAKRSGIVEWGNHPRRRTSPDYWRQPIKWNKRAEAECVRRKVFCASLADVFDNQVDPEWRADLWALIASTPNLDWLLLTKRPQNIAKMLPAFWRGGREDYWLNVWLGTTAENQEEADRRIPHLLKVPAAIRFLSCEPLLGPIDLGCVVREATLAGGIAPTAGTHPINWVITGGESGPNARPTNPDWMRSLRDQCSAAGVPFFLKQNGEWVSPWAAQIDPALCDGKPHVTMEPLHRQHFANSSAPNLTLFRVGKKAAGAMLDGREHLEFPHG